MDAPLPSVYEIVDIVQIHCGQDEKVDREDLQSGATLGWYRDGGPLAVDSDMDVQGTINEDMRAGCKRELFWKWVASYVHPTLLALK